MTEIYKNPEITFELNHYIRFGSNGTKGVTIMAQIHEGTSPPLVKTYRVWFGGGELVLGAFVSTN